MCKNPLGVELFCARLNKRPQYKTRGAQRTAKINGFLPGTRLVGHGTMPPAAETVSRRRNIQRRGSPSRDPRGDPPWDPPWGAWRAVQRHCAEPGNRAENPVESPSEDPHREHSIDLSSLLRI